MTTAGHQQKIFISYARDGGGREFADQIRTELEGYSFNLWQDVVAMEGGESWFEQILQAIRESVVMVLVLNDAALASPNVRDEWEYARKIGTPILPVTKSGTIFKDAPRWLGKNHIFILDPKHPDYAQQHESWLKQLNDPPELKPRHFHTPTLPAHYIKREAEYKAVCDQLLAENQETMVAITTALQGGGGFGKTTLARALCLDDDVRFRYDDGVLWITLGEAPDMLTEVNKLIKILQPDSDTYSDINLAAEALQNLFDTRDCLLVIDDVWHEKFLPSLTRSKRATYLITTRLQTVVSYARADAVTVDEMTTEEAADLLASQIGGDVNPEELRDMAQRLGEWALLLEIVGAELRKRIDSGRTLAQALEYVQKRFERKGITYLNQSAEEERNQAVHVSLEMSLERLRDTTEFPVMPDMPDDCDKRFLELGIFKDDAVIPFSTIALLWEQTADFDDIDTEDVLEAMASLSLFTRYDPADGVDNGTLTLHDVTREILLLLLDEADDMPNAPQLHGTLIDAYGIEAPDNALTPSEQLEEPQYTLPDAYAWEHIAYHLIEAGQADTLITLLTDYHWLYAKLSNTNPNAIIADCDVLLSPPPDTSRKGNVGKRHASSLPENAENVVRLLQSAIRISAHIIGDDVEQLSSQLVGRLVGHKGCYPQIDTLMGVIHDLPKPDLLPLYPTMVQAGGALQRTLAGHTNSVNSVALNNDVAVSASSDRTLRVWNWHTGQHLRTLEGHTSPVRSVALSGDFAVTASDDQTLRVWNWHTGQHLRTLAGHTDLVYSVALSGEFAVSASRDQTLRVWNWHTGQHLRTLERHTNAVYSVALNGEVAISASGDNTLRVWNWHTGQHLRTLEGHTTSVNSVALNGEVAISASGDNTLRVWNWHTGQHLRTLEGHTSYVNSVALNGDVAVSTSGSMWGGSDNSLRVWNWHTGQHLRTFEGHTNAVYSVALNGEVAVTASQDNTLCIWNWRGVHTHEPAEQHLRALEKHTSSVNSVAINSNVAVTASGSMLGSLDNSLRVWNWHTGQHLRTLAGHTDLVYSVALAGEFAVSASKDQTLRVWNWHTGQHLRIFEGHTASVYSVALNGDVAVSASGDNTLRVWNWHTGQHLRTLEGHPASVNSVALNGEVAVTASLGKTLHVWNWHTGQHLHTLEGHTDYVNSVALKGELAVSASGDNTLRVWNWNTGQLLDTFPREEASHLTIAEQYDGLSLNRHVNQHPRFNFVQSGNTVVMHPKTSATVLARVTVDGRIQALGANVDMLVLGDRGGNVHFLRIKDGIAES